jgi:hypothetical protein
MLSIAFAAAGMVLSGLLVAIALEARQWRKRYERVLAELADERRIHGIGPAELYARRRRTS